MILIFQHIPNEVLGGNDECGGTSEDEIEHRIGAAARVIGAVKQKHWKEEN